MQCQWERTYGLPEGDDRNVNRSGRRVDSVEDRLVFLTLPMPSHFIIAFLTGLLRLGNGLAMGGER